MNANKILADNVTYELIRNETIKLQDIIYKLKGDRFNLNMN